MGLFDKIKSSFGKGKIKKDQRERLRNILAESIRDGFISSAELADINTFFENSDLSAQDFLNLKNESFSLAVQWAIADNRVSQEEADSLEQIAQALQISKSVWDKVFRDLNFYHTIHEIECGRLAQTHPPDVILQKNEIGHFSCPGCLLEESTVDRHIDSSPQDGVSFPLMKDVSYRVGSSKDQLQIEKEAVKISDGRFAITNQRIIFSGEQESFSADFTKLMDVRLFFDGIQFSLTSRQKPFILNLYNNHNVEISAALISHIINNQ